VEDMELGQQHQPVEEDIVMAELQMDNTMMSMGMELESCLAVRMETEINLSMEEDWLDKMVVDLGLDGAVGLQHPMVLEKEGCMEEQVHTTTTWDIKEQARGLKRRRGLKDKIYNWTRYLSRGNGRSMSKENNRQAEVWSTVDTKIVSTGCNSILDLNGVLADDEDMVVVENDTGEAVSQDDTSTGTVENMCDTSNYGSVVDSNMSATTSVCSDDLLLPSLTQIIRSENNQIGSDVCIISTLSNQSPIMGNYNHDAHITQKDTFTEVVKKFNKGKGSSKINTNKNVKGKSKSKSKLHGIRKVTEFFSPAPIKRKIEYFENLITQQSNVDNCGIKPMLTATKKPRLSEPGRCGGVREGQSHYGPQ
jgi:hypothetical protein